jgi:acyl transferase domain-containing protein
MANLNCPGQIVISGDKAKIGAAVAAAKDRGMRKVILLNVAGAYHSRLMEPGRAAFATFLEGIAFARPSLTVFSNTTGRPVVEPAEIRAALVRQVVSPVLWEDCMRQAAATGAAQFWELGPGGVLAGLARRINRDWPLESGGGRLHIGCFHPHPAPGGRGLLITRAWTSRSNATSASSPTSTTAKRRSPTGCLNSRTPSRSAR